MVNTIEQRSQATRSPLVKWAGWIMGAVFVPFMLMDIGMHIARPSFVVEASQKMGLNPDVLLPIGIAELVFMGLYLYRKTAIWGAVFFTAFFGGAVMAHVFTQTPGAFAVVTAVLMWGSLVCRNAVVARVLGLGRLHGGQA